MTDNQVKELYDIANYILKQYNKEYNEDLIQDLVFAAYQNLEKYYDKSKHKSEKNFTYMIMFQKLMNLSKKHQIKTIPLDNIVIEYKLDIIKNFEEKELVEKLLPLVDTTTELHIMYGYTLKEISKITNIDYSTIRHQILKNIKKIQEYCEKRRIKYE